MSIACKVWGLRFRVWVLPLSCCVRPLKSCGKKPDRVLRTCRLDVEAGLEPAAFGNPPPRPNLLLLGFRPTLSSAHLGHEG